MSASLDWKIRVEGAEAEVGEIGDIANSKV